MDIPLQPNPALNELAVLIGEWTMTVSNATFLPNSSDTMIGSATFTWIEDGAFLALYQGAGPSGTPDARWIVGRDESERDYTVLYVDGRGVSRVYGMRFMERTCMLWRESSDFSQRFTATLSDDQNTISGQWEKRLGTGSWEHDFDVSYQQTA